MKNLKAFLYPKLRTVRFSFGRFTEEDGTPAQWVMGEVSAEAALEIRKRCQHQSRFRQLAALTAASIQTPDLSDEGLWEALTYRERRTIRTPEDALLALLYHGEMEQLTALYVAFNLDGWLDVQRILRIGKQQ